MKNFFVVFVANVIFFSSVECNHEEIHSRLIALANSCIGDTGATPEMIDKAFEGDFPEDSTFKEMIFCMGKKEHYFDDAGVLDEDKMRNDIKEITGDEASANALVDKCLSQSGTTLDKAFNTAKCLYNSLH
ncbi:unnamed protein product [Acanthoscelides obtectus]|uniref:Uncharacterized protein n=1 Tax=Acanthoscelides obtectus TaxID=200917 RepID=A0A9P0P3Q2_ACAOB|nr:unnamed protein product [Acanthoscelides obtectus]CAK1665930.1 hypothetical protein AOBTE_LOCUS25053 [Acanthoscelides obtectus]